MSSSANIRDIQILSDLKTAFGRFGDDVSQILPSIQKEFEEIEEWLEERQLHWQEQIERAEERLHSARRALSRCEDSGSYDENGDYQEPDCSSEEEWVEDAKDHLAECEGNLETVKQWRHRIENQIADFQNDIHRLTDLASTRTGSAQTFLADKIETLDRYIGVASGALVGLHVQSAGGRIGPDADAPSATEKMRVVIREARYNSCESLGGGINQTFILKNGVKVVFKPANGEAPKEKLPPGIQSGTQIHREKAASLLDELLGLGLVPPTEIISYDGDKGSAQLFQEGYDTAKQLHKIGLITLPIFDRLTDRQRQDWQLLDEVLGHLDRHSGNWMLRARAEGGFDLALIDNGLCLSEAGKARLRARPASQQKIDLTNRMRLERFFAKETEWRSKFCDLVGVVATEHMIKRAQNLLNRGNYE